MSDEPAAPADEEDQGSGRRGWAGALDQARFPHILEAVVAAAPHDALLVLRQTSRAVAAAANARLWEHIELRSVPFNTFPGQFEDSSIHCIEVVAPDEPTERPRRVPGLQWDHRHPEAHRRCMERIRAHTRIVDDRASKYGLATSRWDLVYAFARLPCHRRGDRTGSALALDTTPPVGTLVHFVDLTRAQPDGAGAGAVAQDDDDLSMGLAVSNPYTPSSAARVFVFNVRLDPAHPGLAGARISPRGVNSLDEVVITFLPNRVALDPSTSLGTGAGAEGAAAARSPAPAAGAGDPEGDGDGPVWQIPPPGLLEPLADDMHRLVPQVRHTLVGLEALPAAAFGLGAEFARRPADERLGTLRDELLESLRAAWVAQGAQDVDARAAAARDGALRVLSTAEYRALVGDAEFRIRVGWPGRLLAPNTPGPLVPSPAPASA